jgi:hypothetical protein
MTLFGEMWNINTNGMGDYEEWDQVFHISGMLREFYYRRVKYAKEKHLSENALFLFSIDKENVFSEEYKYSDIF